jgi:hypothetical protein
MRIHRPFAVSLLATALLMAGNHTTAATADASLSHVRLELIDLDLTDGIAPQFIILGSPYSAIFSKTSGVNGPNPDSQSVFGSVGGSLGPVTSDTAPSLASGRVLEGDVWASGVGVLSSAQTWGASTSAVAATHAFAISFTLTPHTQLLLRADAVVTNTGTAGEYANAQATITLQGLDGSHASFGQQTAWLDTLGGIHVDGSSQLLASYANNSAMNLQGAAYAYAIASVQGVAGVVPEPATAGLMLLGLVGLLCRKRG